MIARLGFASAAAVAALAVATASQAQDLRLSYGDLDLSRPEQAKILDQRIDRTARNWCAGEIPTGATLPDPACAGVVRKQLIASMPASAQAAYMASRASTQSAATSAAPRGS